jgi:hypothetical protein
MEKNEACFIPERAPFYLEKITEFCSMMARESEQILLSALPEKNSRFRFSYLRN